MTPSNRQSKLIKEAENSFPEHYNERRRDNRELRLPKQKGFPVVTCVNVDYYKKSKNAECFCATVYCLSKKNTKYRVYVACASDEFDANCQSPLADSDSLINEFAQEFVAHLFFNVLSEKGIAPSEWNDLP